MTPEDRKHIEAIRHALNKALGQARVAVDDAPHWAKDVVWLLDLVERQEAALGERATEIQWMTDRIIWPARDSGISSDALVKAAVLGQDIPPQSYPRDLADLGRCQRAVDRAPAHLKARAEALLAIVSDHLVQRSKGEAAS